MPHWQSWQALMAAVADAGQHERTKYHNQAHHIVDDRKHRSSQTITANSVSSVSKLVQPATLTGNHGWSKTVAGQSRGWQCELVAAASRGS